MLRIGPAMLQIVAGLLRTYLDSQQIGAEHGLRRVEWQRLEAAFAVRSLDSQQNKVDSQQHELDSHHPEAARLALRAADGRASRAAAKKRRRGP